MRRSVAFASKQPPPPTRSSPEAEQPPPTTRSSPEAEQPPPTTRSTPEGQQLSVTTNTSLNNTRTHTQKVEVSVVFSTGGSYTHGFFTQQLYPAVHALNTHLTLDLLPHLEGGCQPGSSECVGGWLVMCATEVLSIPTLHLAFSACLVKNTLGLQAESYPAVMNTAKMCMGTYSVLNWMQMSACVSSGRGEQLFNAAAARLHNLVPSPQDAPIVAFNEEVVIADADSLNLFPSLLCHQLSHIPEAITFCPNNSQLD